MQQATALTGRSGRFLLEWLGARIPRSTLVEVLSSNGLSADQLEETLLWAGAVDGPDGSTGNAAVLAVTCRREP